MLHILRSVLKDKWHTPAPYTDLFSSFKLCKPLCSCLFFTLSDFTQIGGPQDETFMSGFRECVTNNTRDLNFVECPLVLRTDQRGYCGYQNVRLSSVFNNLTIDNDIRNFVDGGSDSR